MRFTVEQLRVDSQACGYAAMLRNWIVKTGRGASGGSQAD
jgi:hypothetical protein